MSQKTRKVRRNSAIKSKSKCEINKYSSDFCPMERENHKITKPKPKKPTQNICSMINFYENIPSYEDIRHLPDYVFSEKMQLLRKIHCDLSDPLVPKARSRPSSRCKRKSPPKKCVVSPSLCDTFSKTSLCDLNVVEECPEDRDLFNTIPSNRSPRVCTPIRRLQLLRERLLCDLNDFDPKFELKYSTQTPTSPKCNEPCLTECPEGLPSYRPDSHPCDLFYPTSCHMDDIPRPRSSRQASSRAITPIIHNIETNDSIVVEKPPPTIKRNLRRAKSCPRNLFGSPTKQCLSWNVTQSQQSNRDNSTPCTVSTVSTRDQRKSKPRKPKAKTPNSMDEYLSSKLVRTNLAANLRQNWSRKKIHDMTEEKLKATMHVSKFIPKCHQWDVRATPGWRSFATEDLTTAQRLREAARREEDRVRQHAHTTNMNIMRTRVKSAQLLLEGRSLNQTHKYSP